MLPCYFYVLLSHVKLCVVTVIPVVAMSHLPEFVMDVQANEVVVLSSCNDYNGQSKSGESRLSRVELDWFYKPLGHTVMCQWPRKTCTQVCYSRPQKTLC